MGERRDATPGEGPGVPGDGPGTGWVVLLVVAGLVVLGLLVFTPLLSVILFSSAFAIGFKLVILAFALIGGAMNRQRDDDGP